MNGSNKATGALDVKRFISIYNDEVKYPRLEDVAEELQRSMKTVINTAAIIRRKIENGTVTGTLIKRSLRQKSESSTPTTLSPWEHAQKRSASLLDTVHDLLTRSQYPVINPEAVVIKGHVKTRYDRITGHRTESESTPRTWLTDTLRVEPVSDATGKVFIFTGAQNDTPIDLPFWENLVAYAEATGAEIVVGPWTYETSWWSENTPSSRSYDPLIMPFLCFGQMRVGDAFMFCGEMNTLPTASNPVSDLTTYSRGRWTIFPHPKIQLVSVPSLDPSQQAVQVMSSGSVTRPQVMPRKAGVKSIFHHQLGATIVEFDQAGDIFCRHLLAASDGSFQDLDVMVENGSVTYGHTIDVLTAGDAHVAKLESRNARSVFGVDTEGHRAAGSMLQVLKPEMLVLHDLHDHESRNHHNKDDVSHKFEMSVRGRDSIMDEVGRARSFLEELITPDLEIIVIESNHDIALERYVREGRYREDGANLKFGLEMDLAYHSYREEVAIALDTGAQVPKFSMVEWAIRTMASASLSSVRWIYDGTSLVRNGIEIGHHGFRGSNGAKGSVAGYTRLGKKMTIGDKHSPAINEGVYGAGVMQLQHGYNKGPSGWAVSQVVQYHNGKRALVTLQNGKWRGR